MRMTKVATIHDPQRGRPGPDALHGPHDRAPQHLALEEGAHGLRAGRPRRRHLRDAELRADQGPDADDRRAAQARPRLAAARTGWRYRSRKLGSDLVLTANGKATVLQDDAPEHLPARHHDAPPGKRVRRAVKHRGHDAHGRLARARHASWTSGTVDGSPFGKGSLALLGTFPRTCSTEPSGCLPGRVGHRHGVDAVHGQRQRDRLPRHRPLHGRDRRLPRDHGQRLEVHDHNTLDGQNGTITVKGFATY